MATVFRLESVAVSGTLATVFEQDVEGAGDLALHIENDGAQALTAAIIEGAPASGAAYAQIDNTAFATLAAGAAARLLVDPGGIKMLRMRATSAAGTTLIVTATNDYESSA